MRTARLLRLAEEDLIQCAAYFQQASPATASKFLDAFDASILLLRRSPELGGICRISSDNLREIRVWAIAGFKNHLIFYRIVPAEIEIVRVLHAARDIDRVLEGLGR